MNIKQAALDLGLNPFALDLVAESFIKMRERFEILDAEPPPVDVVWPTTGPGRYVRIRLELVDAESPKSA